MEWTGLNELREKFLKFFESKEHTILASAPLVPREDNSLLLINSGMAPLKKFFTGMDTPPNKRVTTCQKCIRTPDIERVGKTARHGTYFEMLGNFSFGDYFKNEATAWAWEFITKDMNMPVDRIWISIYEEDDEAKTIWVEKVGVNPDRIVKLGKADNFWEIGAGPCGPCSEMYFDRGEEFGCGDENCAVGCDCDRYVEFWNLVFTQFDSDGKDNYTPLAKPNIDTGMGLERLACIMQGVDNLFEVDTIAKIMQHICDIAKVEYKKNNETDVSLRVITDHVRSTTMMISDGVVPSNEGRGYVLRRLLRRAARHGRLIGIKVPFLFEVCDTVINENKVAYPHLVTNKDYIVKIIKVEEERFSNTIDAGMDLLNTLIEKVEESGSKVLSGEAAFKLYDTFGFPVDLTREILEEKNMTLDDVEFSNLMNQQRERARAARAQMGDLGWEEDVLSGLSLTSKFAGYESTEFDANILAIVVDGKIVDSVMQGEHAAIVLDSTPFYPEGGGQAGDAGILCEGNNTFVVEDCRKSPTGQILHIGEMTTGIFSKNTTIKATSKLSKRQSTMRNHTASHLLQTALRDVLGTHVHQAGQLVDDELCRFDFNHFSAMTAEELVAVEHIVNGMILSAMPINITEMSQKEAQEKGAMALFSEKYGDVVRVVDISGRSIELCGGTHMKNTSELGLFKILKESSVAAGVRRIEAITGVGVLKHMESKEKQISNIAEIFKVGNSNELLQKAVALVLEQKEKDKEIERLNQMIAEGEVKGLFAEGKVVCGVKVITASFNDSTPEALRTLGDTIKGRDMPVVAVLTSAGDEKATIIVVATKKAVEAGIHAGKMVKELTAMIGGSGGGRPDSAMGGTTEVLRVDEAVAYADELVEKMLSK